MQTLFGYIYLRDSQFAMSKTAFELPTPPPLRTPRFPEGTRVPLLVFGWGFGVPELVKWADDNNFRVDLDNHYRHQLAVKEIQRRLPEGHRRIIRIYDEEYTDLYEFRQCFALGSNQTQESLERAQDMKLVDQFLSVLGPDAQLKWHKFSRLY
ncbi:hypothetical protein LshimejAT787_0705650 [Lyophyllum shimeji]|uniref:Uncharacterized protein n=1 Tax=Lyophyllum shimeji TaxID=47721 RepID=A0A9P3PQ93_LYOSH|nr:hypothetical protein LshimejAT787_0705650 [Lyophyllum shimeji]